MRKNFQSHSSRIKFKNHLEENVGKQVFKVIIICSKYLLKKVKHGVLVEFIVSCSWCMQDEGIWYKVSLISDLGQVK